MRLLPQSALETERPIEMRSRPYLVLVETRPYFIISRFHALGSPASPYDLQGLWCVEVLLHVEDVRGQDARKRIHRMISRTYFSNFLHLCLMLCFIAAAHFVNQQPGNDLLLPAHLLNLYISKKAPHFKGRVLIKVSSAMGKQSC